MASGEFHKMHGLGNDFVVIDVRAHLIEMTKPRASAIADRNTGIGCDQLILLEPSQKADLAMRIFNADGGEVEACGNAARCVVKLLGNDVSIETAGGVIDGHISGSQVTIDMGQPRFDWEEIPLAYAMDTEKMPLAWEELAGPVAVNVGNPHVVFIVGNNKAVDLERLGPIIEHDDVFPERVNVNVADIALGEINLRVWERGVGETRACGTGACATAVAAIARDYVQSPARVHLPGGTLTVEWERGGNILMAGDAVHVFTGQADWDDF
ncbi:MAG: diaminopimelate epimerase [Sphingorhabdus sp.]